VNIGTVLCTVEYEGENWERLERAMGPGKIIHVSQNDRDAVSSALQEADVAILQGDAPAWLVSEGKNLKWIHCNHAGLNNSCTPLIFERGIILTGSSGRSGPVLAEHTFFLALSLIYDSRALEANQKAHKWANLYDSRRGLFGKTMGIIGLGYTGKEIAARAKAFGMRVLAYDREFFGEPENVDAIWSSKNNESVDELLRQSDIVALSVRLSDETYHMIDERAFSIMKDSALLINMARGSVVDEEALVRALESGSIAGAASDVFEVEPLPKESPLWDFPNFVITAHNTPEMPDMPGNCIKIIGENFNRYRNGQPMLNQAFPEDVYTKRKG
jgi:phosphoglycerate dehydrogenase-like enzyme